MKQLLDAGPQPIGNRFLRSPEERDFRHPMRLGQCAGCGLIQLIDPAPVSEVVPRYDWISYNEPEGHLDGLVDLLFSLPGIGGDAVIAGVSYKDDSTLERFRTRGIRDAWRLDAERDLGVTDSRASLETLQERLTPELTTPIGQARGQVDLLIVRHLLEHGHDTRRLLAAVAELVRPGGYLAFEVPDCSRALENADCTMLWEEHVLYFTPSTLKGAFGPTEFLLEHFECYPYPTENSLVAVVRRAGSSPGPRPEQNVPAEIARGQRFVSGLYSRIEATKAYLDEFRDQDEKVAIFGAGHLAVTFVSVMDVADRIAFVVDDNPHKRDLFLPGSGLPIRGSSALLEEDVRLCLLSLSPESEAKVMGAQRRFLDAGGIFRSIFPGQDNSIPV